MEVLWKSEGEDFVGELKSDLYRLAVSAIRERGNRGVVVVVVEVALGSCFQVVLPMVLPQPRALRTAAGVIAVMMAQIPPPLALPD